MRLIVRNAAAITKILQSNLPYDLQNRYVPAEKPGDLARIVTTWVVPGTSDPIGSMEIEDQEPSRWNATLLAMFLPTLAERQAAILQNAEMLRDLREIVIDGVPYGLKQLFGADLDG